MISLLACGAAADQAATSRPAEPRRLTAWGYVAVLPGAHRSEATRDLLAIAVQKALPAGKFRRLTVADEGTLAEAMTRALAGGADVFLHVVVGRPERIAVAYAPPQAAPPTEGAARVTAAVPPARSPTYCVRSTVGAALSVAGEGRWRRVRQVTLKSTDAPGAEIAFVDRDDALVRAWVDGARLTAERACEKALNDYFFGGVTLRAIPAAGSGDDPKDARALVQIELVNRSHCRILDATATAERYNALLRRWEPLDGPRAATGPGGGSPEGSWEFPGAIDPGRTAFSRPRRVEQHVARVLREERHRLVLHATPAVRTVIQPKTPHPLRLDVPPVR